jgi:hypothetical protein
MRNFAGHLAVGLLAGIVVRYVLDNKQELRQRAWPVVAPIEAYFVARNTDWDSWR